MNSFFPLALLASTLAAQSNLQFVNGAFANIDAQRVIPLANGSHVIIGNQTVAGPVTAEGNSYRSALLIYSINPDGTQDLNFGTAPGPVTIGGSGNDIASDAVLDSSGNFWIVGRTDSDDFPLVNPIVSQKIAYRTSGFVLELGPTGRTILFSSYLGGYQPSNMQRYSTATNLALGSNGDLYLFGNTSEPDFPTTPGVFGTPASLVNGFEGQVYTWVMRISPAGALGYSTLLGGSESNCPTGNGCVGILAANFANSIAVGASGNVTVSGQTSAQDFPVTGGSYQTECQCSPAQFTGFISRIAPDASHLIWSTYFGSSSLGTDLLIALDAAGNVFAFGHDQNLYAAKLQSDGSGLIYMTALGSGTIAGMVVDANGNALMAGTSTSPTFPGLPSVFVFGNDFVLVLDPTGATPQILYRPVTGTVTEPPAIDASGNLLLLSAQGSLLELYGSAPLSQPGILAVGNAATYTMGTGFAPGELVSLYGVGLGPASGGVPELPPGGGFPTEFAGVQVTIAGTPAPLLYVGENQINFQVPFEAPMNLTAFPEIQVTAPSGMLTVQANALPSLGLFYAATPPYAAALNQDGSVNSAANPAIPGSIVSLFGTGEVFVSGLDGALATTATPLSQPDNRLQVFDNLGNELTLLYAGAAPGLIDGVFQLNVQIPPQDLDPTLTLHSVNIFGTELSNSVQVYAH
jgi:uncharacterized protein (TIGR03437 family)